MRHRLGMALAVMAVMLAAAPWLLRAGAVSRPSQVTLPSVPLLPTTTRASLPPTSAATTTVPAGIGPAGTGPAETAPAQTVVAPVVPTSVETTTTAAVAETLPVGPSPLATSPPITSSTPRTVPVRTAPSRVVSAARTIQPASVTGSYGVGVGAVLAFVLILIGFAARMTHGGTPVTNQQRQWRLIAGIATLALAAVVGIIGYLRLSLEPAVNRQIPYLASAGMALVLLAAIGASLIVAEQLRADDHRLDELEAAVRQLAESLAPSIEAPARRAAEDAEPEAAR